MTSQHRIGIDRVVTNRWLALPIFALIMFAVYYISVSNNRRLPDGLDQRCPVRRNYPPNSAGLAGGWGVAAWLEGLLVDGILAGVGAVSWAFCPK